MQMFGRFSFNHITTLIVFVIFLGNNFRTVCLSLAFEQYILILKN
jgi:hypothetical protein